MYLLVDGLGVDAAEQAEQRVEGLLVALVLDGVALQVLRQLDEAHDLVGVGLVLAEQLGQLVNCPRCEGLQRALELQVLVLLGALLACIG